jgi:hypothetical protein
VANELSDLEFRFRAGTHAFRGFALALRARPDKAMEALGRAVALRPMLGLMLRDEAALASLRGRADFETMTAPHSKPPEQTRQTRLSSGARVKLERNGRLRRPTFKRRRPSPATATSSGARVKLERNGRLRRPTFKRRRPPPATTRPSVSEAELERETGFEPATSTLARSRSTK